MNALELRNIKHSYNGRVVLDIPSFAFEKGGRMALVGPNGSGKTTLLSIAALLTHPGGGDVVIDGEKVSWNRRDEYRSKIAFMAQDPYFFSGSLERNLHFALSASNLTKDERTGLIGKYTEMLGLTELVRRSPRTFSGGESKRAAIARALCRETPILLLDEPFTHIDSLSKNVLSEVINNLPGDRTVIFSTHDLSHAYTVSDSVVTLQDGSVAPHTPENLFQLEAVRTGDGYDLKFGTGSTVYFPGDLVDRKKYTVSINPSEVLVSKEPISSSARNSFSGVVNRIEKTGRHTVLVTVDCSPDMPVRSTLTERAMRDLGFTVGDIVWVHFKSTAVHVFH